MADLLLGQVTSIQWAFGLANAHFRSTGYAAYFQDDWKIAKNLTVNLGLRSERPCVALGMQPCYTRVGPGETKRTRCVRICCHVRMPFGGAQNLISGGSCPA